MRFKFVAVISIMAAFLLAACGGKSDADLQKAVQDKLVADNVSGVTVAVKDGVATLSGEVADVTVKNKAEASAKGVEGIKSVSNNVSLRALATPTPPPADPALKGKIEENLKKAGCTGLTVDTAGGRVTVTGKISDAKYAQCVQVVQESGALGFNNQIQKGN